MRSNRRLDLSPNRHVEDRTEAEISVAACPVGALRSTRTRGIHASGAGAAIRALRASIFFAMLLFSFAASAQVALVGSWSEFANNGSAPTPNSFTASAGSSRVIVVAVTSSYTTAQTPTSITATFNGNALTLVPDPGDLSTSAVQHTYLFYRVLGSSASSTTADIVVNLTSGGTAFYHVVRAAVYQGVDQTTPLVAADARLLTSGTADATSPVEWGTALTIPSNGMGIQAIVHQRTDSNTLRTLTLNNNWAEPTGVTLRTRTQGGGTQEAVAHIVAQRSVSGSTTAGHTLSLVASTKVSMVGMVLLPATVGPGLTYAPTAGATAGTGGPVNFTGVTTVGSTGAGTISATPTGGFNSGTTTLNSFSITGADAASFTLTSGTSLNFSVGGAAQNITLTCTSGAVARTANLQATETITGGATTQRFWVLNCPAGQLGPSLAYSPAAGATSGTGGPVSFTGVTTDGSTGNGTISVTPSGGQGSGQTTLGTFVLSGADAAFFTRTSPATLTFTAGVGTPQNVTLTCTAGLTARTANLQATETITNGATTQRFWVLNCPAGTPVAPTITSGASTTFTALQLGGFQVTASGSPTISFTRGGAALPSGVVFDSVSGLLYGTPAAGTQGVYNITFTATNSAGSSTVQNFTLTVNTAGANAARRGVVYTYENTTSATIDNNTCPNGGATQTFVVPASNSFTVGGAGTISVGVEVSHPLRNELTLTLTPPSGPAVTLQTGTGGAVADLNVTYTTNTEDNAANETTNDADPLTLSGGLIHYRRFVTVATLDAGSGTAFYTGVSNGTWTLRVCDTGGTNNSGTLLRSKLVLVNTAATISNVCTTKATYNWGDNGNNVVFNSAIAGEVTITEVSSKTEAQPTDLASFRTFTDTFGGDTGYFQQLMQMNPQVAGTQDAEIAAEYARFSFSTPVLGLRFGVGDIDISVSAPFEDYVKIEPFDEAGLPVPYQMSVISTVNNGYAGEWVEGDTDNITDGTANVIYEFDSPVKTFNLVYAQGNQPESEPRNQAIALGDLSFCAFDYGDAPSTYATSTARHGLGRRTTLFIGASAPDGEINAAPGSTATGDGSDEGTVTFLPYTGAETGAEKAGNSPESMTCSGFTTTQGDYCQTLSVTNSSGTTAQLVGFIDFNGDGDFLDAGERSLPNLGGASFAGATDGTWNTGNVASNPSAQTVVLVWSGFAPPTTNTTMARFRLTTDTAYLNNASPPAPGAQLTDGEMEDHTIIAGTLPVTLSYVEATRLDAQRVRLSWGTATETGTMGYRILQGSGGRAVALANDLVAARDLSSTKPSEYQLTLTTSSGEPLYIEEVSANGQVERFGPFEIGVPFGARQSLTPVPWQLVNSEVAAHAVVDRQARIQRGGARGSASVDVLVTETGLQHVPISAVVDAGGNFIGQPVSALKLSQGNTIVPVRLVSGNTIAADSILEFYGEAVDSLYTRTRPYRLEIAAGGAAWREVSGTPVEGAFASQVRKVAELADDRFYTLTAAGEDPWYFDTIARSGATPASKQWTLQLSGVNRELAGVLSIEASGGSSYPNLDPDHRYKVFINGAEAGQFAFDGITTHSASFDVPGAILREGANTIRLESVATGEQIDRLYIEGIRLQHYGPINAAGNAVVFTASDLLTAREAIFGSDFTAEVGIQLPCGSGCEQFAVTGFASTDVVALQVSDVGTVELTGLDWQQAGSLWTARARALLFGTSDGGMGLSGQLVLTERSSAKLPSVRPAIALDHPIAGGNADLMIIASARFAGSLGSLVTAREAEGLRVRVVDVAQIYEHYSDGIIDPEAIREFASDAYNQLSTRYLLLVGGDTYDYLNRLNLGSVSDVPTIYRKTHEFVSFAPVDGEFGDFDQDGRPEIPVGRLPARTASELSSILGKVLQPLPANPQSLVFVAERLNAAEGINYKTQADQLLQLLGPAWQAGQARINLDDYPATTAGTASARADLMQQITLGRNWVGYYGHASPATWSRESLLQGSQLGSLLNNVGKAPLVTEFGCWGGYFVEPTYTTMNHAWLLTQERGARAMIASSSLTETSSDKAIAAALIGHLATPGIRLGDALLNARRDVGATAPEMKDVVMGMSLFGDPTARLTPAN